VAYQKTNPFVTDPTPRLSARTKKNSTGTTKPENVKKFLKKTITVAVAIVAKINNQ